MIMIDQQKLHNMYMRGAEDPNCRPVSRHSVSLHSGTHLIAYCLETPISLAG